MFKTWYYSLLVQAFMLSFIYKALKLIENVKVKAKVAVAICYDLNNLLVKTPHTE